MPEQTKPKVNLIGKNGNIFNLVGIASKELKKAGLEEQSNEMKNKVLAAGSYEEALCIIMDYCDVY